jgi:hypothetical protein
MGRPENFFAIPDSEAQTCINALYILYVKVLYNATPPFCPDEFGDSSDFKKSRAALELYFIQASSLQENEMEPEDVLDEGLSLRWQFLLRLLTFFAAVYFLRNLFHPHRQAA